MNNIFTTLLYQMEKHHDTVLCTIIADNGSTPRGRGAQMLVGQAGLLCGTIGGGAVEGQTIELGKKLLQERRSAVHEYRLHRNKVEDIGMVCGGDVTVHLQFIAADDPVWKTLAGDVLRRVALRQPGWLTLALDDVQNPGNLGTIVRLADWFGIGDVVCSEATADCFNPKVVQATMGAILRVRVHYCDLEAYLAAERAAGTPIYGTFLEGDDIYRTQLTPTGIVLMGNEGRGVTPACAAQVTRKLFIPPYPAERHATESLNVAMATGIVCAEFRRQASAGR